MQIHIEHDTTILYDAADDQIVQAWRMWPLSSSSQTITEWQVQVDGRLLQSRYTDGFGNYLATRTITGAQPVHLHVRGRVQTFARDGFHQREEPFPPAFFLCSTSLTAAGAEIIDLLSRTAARIDSVDRLLSLVNVLRERVGRSSATIGAELSADQVHAQGTGRPQDHAHLLIAAAQAAGAPARCVTGYCRSSPSNTVAMHVWSEVFLSDRGWLGVDAINRCVIDDRYVRVACGRDIRDAAPVRAVAIGRVAEVIEMTHSSQETRPNAAARTASGQSQQQSLS